MFVFLFFSGFQVYSSAYVHIWWRFPRLVPDDSLKRVSAHGFIFIGHTLIDLLRNPIIQPSFARFIGFLVFLK